MIWLSCQDSGEDLDFLCSPEKFPYGTSVSMGSLNVRKEWLNEIYFCVCEKTTAEENFNDHPDHPVLSFLFDYHSLCDNRKHES